MRKADLPSRRDLLAAGLAGVSAGLASECATRRGSRSRHPVGGECGSGSQGPFRRTPAARVSQEAGGEADCLSAPGHSRMARRAPAARFRCDSERRTDDRVCTPVRRDRDAADPPRAGPGQADGRRKNAGGHGLRRIHHSRRGNWMEAATGSPRGSTCSWWTRSSPSSSGRAFAPCSPTVTGRRAVLVGREPARASGAFRPQALRRRPGKSAGSGRARWITPPATRRR